MMRNIYFIFLILPALTATAQTTDDFVPQEMDWGTYIPFPLQYVNQNGATPGASSSSRVVNPFLSSSGEVFCMYTTSEDTDAQQQLITPGAHQVQKGEHIDGLLFAFNSDGSLKFGTYFGGEGDDTLGIFAVDAADNIYLYGSTWSYNNIATPGADKETYTGYVRPPLLIENPIGGDPIEAGVEMPISDGVLAKFDSEGNLLWSTYSGGHRGANISRPLLGQTGIYIFGNTLSISGFSTPGVNEPDWPDEVPQEASVGFTQPLVPYMAKYSFDGELLWRTYTYGLQQTYGEWRDYVMDEEDNLYVLTQSPNQKVIQLDADGFFVAEHDLPEEALYYTSIKYHNNQLYFVGASEDNNTATSGTFRSEMLTGPSAQPYQHFLMKSNMNFQKQWATFLPIFNGGLTTTMGLLIDEEERVYVSGYTLEENLATGGVFQQQKNGFFNGYVMRLTETGALDWFTYFGDTTATGSPPIAKSEDAIFVSISSGGNENVVNENGFFHDETQIEESAVGTRAHLMKLIKSKSSSTDDFLKGKINVYPNPVQEILNIDLSDELLSNQLSYALYDLLGKQIANGSLGVSQNHQINVSNLATGVYLLKITDQATQASQQFKIIKE